MGGGRVETNCLLVFFLVPQLSAFKTGQSKACLPVIVVVLSVCGFPRGFPVSHIDKDDRMWTFPMYLF